MPLVAPESLEISLLPCALFTEWKNVPAQAGVYFISCAKDARLLYIGISRSLQARIQTHHMKATFAPFVPLNVAWLLADGEESSLPQLLRYERACIRHWKPLLNDGGPHPIKPGPTPKGFVRVNAFLPPDMIGWAKQHPEGLSGLIRRLMAQERQRLEASC